MTAPALGGSLNNPNKMCAYLGASDFWLNLISSFVILVLSNQIFILLVIF